MEKLVQNQSLGNLPSMRWKNSIPWTLCFQLEPEPGFRVQYLNYTQTRSTE